MADADDIDNRISKLQKSIRTSDYDTLQNQVYICVANGCILLTSFLQLQGKPGWSAELRDANGQSVLTNKEQVSIESAFKQAGWILPFFSSTEDKQEGGALTLPTLPAGSSMLQKVGSQLTGEDVSLDRMMQSFLKKLQDMDEFWASFAKNDPGLSKIITEGDIRIPTPNPLITIPIPKKPLVQLLVTVLDAFRLSAGLAGEDSFLLTLILFLEELVTGQWRQMLMTAVGFLSPTGMAVGILFKYLMNAWQLISPDLRNDITKDMYKGTKSLLIGFLLWSATTLPPEFVRQPVEDAIGKLRTMIQGLEEKVQTLTQGAQEQLAAQGFQMTFPGLQFDELKKISMEDIQTLQTLARWPVMVCSTEFQDILKNLKSDPIFRLILELSNIPVLDEDRYEVCGTSEGKSITEILVEKAEPVLTPIKGGGKRKSTRRKAKKPSRQTRKKHV